ncbi:hypothetical protein LOTGIDRAFT_155625 [Lottia gigantea]|uniref:Uncharacterized protein n=1 Tax=Lottia gigantea TaxID=225164 RepID=V3ZP30_LOTGI|nr:hypothetical protein LOTGIDRAFT_155625 [Lottia gigantea]ESO82611.1 hypothetical protein LOTGIDRAFT_155625 [Lottia gigantea]
MAGEPSLRKTNQHARTFFGTGKQTKTTPETTSKRTIPTSTQLPIDHVPTETEPPATTNPTGPSMESHTFLEEEPITESGLRGTNELENSSQPGFQTDQPRKQSGQQTTVESAEPERINSKITNLSSHSLNENEIKLLTRGLKFTPTPRNPNECELKSDVNYNLEKTVR